MYPFTVHGGTYSYLVGCLVEELFVRFDAPNLSVIIGLSMLVERVLQPLESQQKDTQWKHNLHFKSGHRLSQS